MRRLVLAYTFLGSLIAAGCSSAGAPESADGAVAQTKSAIAYGTADGNTHPAVIAILANAGGGSFSECSGSIVQYKNGKAYVLTAAHCCTDGAPDIVVVSNDYTAGENALFGGPVSPPVYSVDKTSVYYDAQFNMNNLQSGHDFCMFKFAVSTNVSTLALPTATACASNADGVANNVSIEHVGFGVTDTNSNNTARNTGTDVITAFDSLTISYKQGYTKPSKAGPCEGDSGGPALIPPSGPGVTEAQQTIVATTSYGGTQTCGSQDVGVSDRVCSEIGTGKFITSFLNDAPIGTQPGSGSSGTDCNTCAQNSESSTCASQANACANDQKCLTLSQCLGNCQTQSCVQTCENTAGQTAVNELNAFDQCVCNTACTTQCATECGGSSSSSSSSSSGGASCGLQSTDATCNTCLDAKCCNEGAACANDQTCVGCLQSQTSACNSNSAFAGLITCLQNHCDNECLGGSSSASSSSGGIASGSSSSSSTSGLPGSSSSGSLSGGTGGANGGNGGAGGAGGGDGGSGGNDEHSGCSVGATGAGADPASGGSAVGLLLGLALAFSRRRRA